VGIGGLDLATSYLIVKVALLFSQSGLDTQIIFIYHFPNGGLEYQGRRLSERNHIHIRLAFKS
jgi:hypothetical protein